MFSIAGKKAFVTGGSSGIGLAVSKCFVEHGASVVIADINQTDTSGLGNTHSVICDVSDESSVQSALKTAQDLLGGALDIVVLNAGVGDVGPILTAASQNLIEKITRINQWGVTYGLKHAPANMSDEGSIICTSSMASFIGLAGQGIYAASKRAVTSLTETAAIELGGRGIRANCVCPGYTETAMGSGDEGQLLCETFTALGRVATVDDMTGVYLFLASDASRYMTGQSLKVDGGWHCGLTPRALELVTGSSEAPS